ncbi:MAG: glutamate 5-kinase [Desulfuromonas thiophila]|jgi:glutamate 5-kinase|uniref:glutamate 5-kinase n=1 Tax=Desulfuromonas thiophila TaxID=57664 RepID=UPI0024A8C6D8|nr:glutamate 5-kinase [Desulfuromonas thiophila]MCK9172533.1 glutamate 5-kinase [Desulfuromonas thiophila]MDD3800936.1 glutamate 5-kinase [Desulfuromonas thiophila]MDY0397038.1 glutamate 5-kinase [Desulfuromonas thiophila]
MPHNTTPRAALIASVRRVVIKIGSAVLSGDSGLNLAQIEKLSANLWQLRQRGYDVIVVSSGAVAAGKKDLGICGRPQTIALKQAAAAIGQSRLMRFYRSAFRSRGGNVAQILLTRDDLANRRRYLNARNTLMTLLEYGIVPIINENDTVVVDEIRFGDNDNLSSMVASLVEANLLVILSDVDGLYDRDPRQHAEARLIPEVERISADIEAMAGNASGQLGTGGMASKLKAAKRATLQGVAAAIINGLDPDNLLRFFDGEDIGTYFIPASARMTAKKHWIAFTKKPRGKLFVDAGAHRALAMEGKSLLPSGIRGVEGTFERGDSVSLYDNNGNFFARGVTNYTLAELLRIMGKKTSEIIDILGYKYADEVIHRDNLVLSTADDDRPLD